MTNKRLHIIAIDEKYLNNITNQIKIVFGNTLILFPTTIKNIQTNTILQGDIILASHPMISGLIGHLIPDECTYIIARRDINYIHTKQLLDLPPKQKILIVNDTQSNINATVKLLEEVLFEHYYYAYTPEGSLFSDFDYIVVPGERHLLPSDMTNVIDIGDRILSFATFEMLNSALNVPFSVAKLTKMYIKSLASISQYKTSSETELDSIVEQTQNINTVAHYTFKHIKTSSKEMLETISLAKALAPTTDVIHLVGESGTGKSMFGQAIHNYSDRASYPFLELNCMSKSDAFIDTTLFGINKEGKTILGLIDLATSGTIIIKNIHELSLPLQDKLYNFIEYGYFYRANCTLRNTADVRLITSSMKPLDKSDNQAIIKPSLYARLNPFSVYIPLLNERKRDFNNLIENIKIRLNRTDLKLTNEAMKQLKQYNWPGNVKELYNVISYFSCLDKEVIHPIDFPIYLRYKNKPINAPNSIGQEQTQTIINKIEEHGFLDESIAILNVLKRGKENHKTYGRLSLKRKLDTQNKHLSEQQLRLRLEVLQELELILVRQGRVGTTISRYGESFLDNIEITAQ